MGQNAIEPLAAVIFGLTALIFLALGAACFCTDLSGMFFYYKDGYIHSIRGDRPVLRDTPQNRRKLSRCFGLIWLLGAAASGIALLFLL